MTITRFFLSPKDPQTSARYEIEFGEQLSAVNGVTATESTAAGNVPRPAGWTTPGDQVAGAPLVATDWQVSGNDASFVLSGGVPGKVYAVRADVVLAAGGERFGSLLMLVTGL